MVPFAVSNSPSELPSSSLWPKRFPLGPLSGYFPRRSGPRSLLPLAPTCSRSVRTRKRGTHGAQSPAPHGGGGSCGSVRVDKENVKPPWPKQTKTALPGKASSITLPASGRWNSGGEGRERRASSRIGRILPQTRGEGRGTGSAARNAGRGSQVPLVLPAETQSCRGTVTSAEGNGTGKQQSDAWADSGQGQGSETRH